MGRDDLGVVSVLSWSCYSLNTSLNRYRFALYFMGCTSKVYLGLKDLPYICPLIGLM